MTLGGYSQPTSLAARLHKADMVEVLNDAEQTGTRAAGSSEPIVWLWRRLRTCLRRTI